MRMRMYTLSFILCFLAFSPCFSSQDEAAPQKPLVVFLHGIGASSGQLGNTDHGKSLFKDVILLEPDAAEIGHAPGLWFSIDVNLARVPEITQYLEALEPKKPGISQFTMSIIKKLEGSEEGLMGGLSLLKDSQDLMAVAREKKYLINIVEMMSLAFAKAMEPTLRKLDQYIEENLRSRQLTHSPLILCGWSMGAVMALNYAAQREVPCRAVIAANAFFVPPNTIKPIQDNFLFVTGKQDKVIPFWLQKMSLDALLLFFKAKVEVFFSEEEGHSGFVEGTTQLETIKKFLAKHGV